MVSWVIADNVVLSPGRPGPMLERLLNAYGSDHEG